MRVITSDCKITIDKSFKVEAGPGAGKTHFLINHIKNVVQNSNRLRKTGKVACITYTNSAVENIIERLGGKVAGHVEVSTIHSFLYKHVVKPYCFKLSKDFNLDIGRFKNHTTVRVSERDLRSWLNNSFSSNLKHPNTKNQILKVLYSFCQIPAVKNWLMSIYTTLNNSTEVIFKGDLNKATIYDSEVGYRQLDHSNVATLEDAILDYKIVNWKMGIVDHEDILFFSHV